MMVMLPLRSVMASAQTTCEMHGPASQAVEDHSMHVMHLMTEDLHESANEADACCCCDSAMKCTGDCGIGMSVSFIAQSAIALPALNETAFRTHVDNNLVFRDLAPPIRPPENLQI